jgi:hypothetical protein
MRADQLADSLGAGEGKPDFRIGRRRDGVELVGADHHEFMAELFARRDQVGERHDDAIDLRTPSVRDDADFHAGPPPDERRGSGRLRQTPQRNSISGSPWLMQPP